MKNVLRSLIPKPKMLLNALLAPAEDPRQVFSAAHQRQKELMGKERQSRANINASKKRLQAKTEEIRNKLFQLESSLVQRPPDSGEGLARLAERRSQAALEELHTLEQQVQMLEQNEWALSLIEQRLAEEIEALSTRQEVVAARTPLRGAGHPGTCAGTGRTKDGGHVGRGRRF